MKNQGNFCLVQDVSSETISKTSSQLSHLLLPLSLSNVITALLLWYLLPCYALPHVHASLNTQAAITIYHRLGGWNTWNLFAHNSGDLKSKVKVLTRSVTGEGPVLGVQMSNFFLCSHVVFPGSVLTDSTVVSLLIKPPIPSRGSQSHDLI